MSARKTISNSFVVTTLLDGESAPYYFQEWFAWSNDSTTASVTTAPTIAGSWATSIPAQGSYAYLWRKSIRYVWNDNTRQYTAETPQYFRMSGTNGTSISPKGTVDFAYSTKSGFPPPSSSLYGKTAVAKESDKIYKCDIPSPGYYDWLETDSTASVGDSYTVDVGNLNGNYQSTNNMHGHFIMWSSEASQWIDLGQFQGQNGKTYYTHVAWAMNVVITGGVVTSVEGFITDKSPNDTTHLWMGVLVNESSGADPSDATSYTWSYTKGVKGDTGNDAVRYELVSSVNVITLSEGEVPIFDQVFFSLYRTVGSNNPTIYSTVQQWQNELFQLYYVVDGVQTEVGYDYMLSYDTKVNYHDIEQLYNQHHDVTWVVKKNNSVIAQLSIGVVKNGEKGNTGARGKVGRFFYFAGVFDTTEASTTFVVNDAQAPYFEHTVYGQKRYHVFDYETNGSYTMAQMWSISNQSWNNAPWELMTNDFKYLITEAMFAEFAKLGSAIFSGDWMISQQGGIDGRTSSSITAYMVGSTVYPYTVTIKPYTLFDANHPLGGVASKNTYNTTISSSETSHNIIATSGRKAGVLYKVTSRVKDGTTFSGTPLRFQIDKNGVYDPITLFTITEEEADYTAYFMVPENTTYRFRLVRDSSTTQSEIITSVIEQVCFETQYAVDLLTGKSYFSDAYVKGSITYPSLVIDTDNYSTYRINEDGNSYLQLSDVTETNIYVYFFPSISYSSDLGYYYAYVALPEITEEMIGKEITICNATTDALSRTDLAMELRIISHGTISGTGLSVDLNDPKGLLVTRLSGINQWSGAVPPYRTEVDALKVPLQHEVRLRAANKNMWVAVGAPYSIIGE